MQWKDDDGLTEEGEIKKERFKICRHRAKAINFGIAGGQVLVTVVKGEKKTSSLTDL